MAVGALVLGAIGSDMVGRLVLVALADEGEESGIGYDNRLSLSSRFHNHLQASREYNTSGARSGSSLAGDAASAPLSRDVISMVLFPDGDPGLGGTRGSRKGVRLLGSLGK